VISVRKEVNEVRSWGREKGVTRGMQRKCVRGWRGGLGTLGGIRFGVRVYIYS